MFAILYLDHGKSWKTNTAGVERAWSWLVAWLGIRGWCLLQPLWAASFS
jgi:hypothetical protein